MRELRTWQFTLGAGETALLWLGSSMVDDETSIKRVYKALGPYQGAQAAVLVTAAPADLRVWGPSWTDRANAQPLAVGPLLGNIQPQWVDVSSPVFVSSVAGGTVELRAVVKVLEE